jgi:hypothetical protein
VKTLQQVKEQFKSDAIDGRDASRLIDFFPAEDWPKFGFEIKEGHAHTPKEWTRENILEQLEKDVDFGFEKALNKRGISSSLMAEVVKMWNRILEDGLEGFDEYAQYGLPLFKATAEKYGFPNPIGKDAGSEHKYSSESESDSSFWGS